LTPNLPSQMPQLSPHMTPTHLPGHGLMYAAMNPQNVGIKAPLPTPAI
jgi:hypothetical protein